MNIFGNLYYILSDKIVIEKSYFFTNKMLLALFLPILIEQALEFFVGFIDTMMVSSIGEAAVSGVFLVDSIIMLLIFSFAALATGGAVIAGQYLGNGEVNKGCEASNQLVWFAAIVSVAIAIFVLLFQTYIIDILFGQIGDDVFYNAHIYLNYMILTIPFIAVYNAGAAIYRTMGNAKLPMIIMFSCDLLNVIGNAILLFVFGFGVEGVAIPTVFARIIAATVMIYFVLNQKNVLHIKKTLKHSFDFSMLKKVLDVGIPYGVENGLFQLGRILILSLVSTFGTVAIAANAVGISFGIFSVLPGFAINLGLTTVISRCVGANDYTQAKFYNKKIILITFLAHLFTNLIIFIILYPVLSLYGLTPECKDLAAQMIIWHGIFGIIIWPLAFTLPTTFRGAGDAKWPMIVSLLIMFICRIGLAYVIADYFGWGVFGTWVAMFIDWYVRAIFFIYRYLSGKWMEYRDVGNSFKKV